MAEAQIALAEQRVYAPTEVVEIKLPSEPSYQLGIAFQLRTTEFTPDFDKVYVIDGSSAEELGRPKGELTRFVNVALDVESISGVGLRLVRVGRKEVEKTKGPRTVFINWFSDMYGAADFRDPNFKEAMLSEFAEKAGRIYAECEVWHNPAGKGLDGNYSVILKGYSSRRDPRYILRFVDGGTVSVKETAAEHEE